MDFYAVLFRKSGDHWVALCLENGLAGQADSKEMALNKLKEAIICFEEARNSDADIYCVPISVKELHEFLLILEKQNYHPLM